jgi:hypothetical protein
MADKDEDGPTPHGTRKDGKPYKEGNTREDGSYAVGKDRTPVVTRFAEGDGRRRGKRAKGTRNLMTEWREELNQKITINEGGKSLKVSKRRALIKSKVSRGLGKSDRANEEALRYAELSEKRDPGLQTDDLELIEAWLSGLDRTGDSDDLSQAPDDVSGAGRSGGDGGE